MIFTDGIHIITDGPIEELHAFAVKAKIKKCWFENKTGKNRPHYDIPVRHPLYKNSNLLEYIGAEFVSSKNIVLKLKSWSQ